MKYAAQTEVSAEKSRVEIERTLTRYGATSFCYMTHERGAAIGFVMHGRSIKFMMPMPPKTEKRFTHYKRGHVDIPRTAAAAQNIWEQEGRQRWRALALCIKAKLEAVEAEITTFEHEFLAHFIAHDGRTVGDHIIPQLNDQTNPPRLLLLGQ